MSKKTGSLTYALVGFGVSVATPAFAQAADAAALGPYPILQFAAAVVVLAGVAWAFYKGMKDQGKPGTGNGHNGDGVAATTRYIYFEGPLKKHLETMDELAKDSRATINLLDRLEREDIGEELRKQTGLLERIIGSLERMQRK